jgi:hypothetical protein
MLLYWEVLKAAVEKGYTIFDFGRSTRDGGTYRFKKQWGAVEYPFYWHYWLRHGPELRQLNPTSAKFRVAVKLWQRLPLSLANRLGPALVKSLP